MSDLFNKIAVDCNQNNTIISNGFRYESIEKQWVAEWSTSHTFLNFMAEHWTTIKDWNFVLQEIWGYMHRICEFAKEQQNCYAIMMVSIPNTKGSEEDTAKMIQFNNITGTCQLWVLSVLLSLADAFQRRQDKCVLILLETLSSLLKWYRQDSRSLSMTLSERVQKTTGDAELFSENTHIMKHVEVVRELISIFE